MSRGTVTILGCGNSTGVPAIGNYWGTCNPDNPKNTRTRCSIAVEAEDTTVIVDTGPEFRTQINRENINNIDGVLYTHQHSDHTNGIDDLRVISIRNKTLTKCYVNKSTFDDLKTRFHYLFDGGNHELYPPIIEPKILSDADFGQKQTLGQLEFVPFEQDHGTVTSVGYRFGDLGYSVDMWKLDDKAIEALRGIKTWIVDAAAYNQTDNAVHANLQTIYDLNDQIGAQEVYLTSLSLAMDYQTLCDELPNGYQPAYDGLKIHFD